MLALANDFGQSDPLVFALLGIFAIAAGIAILIIVIVWPLDRIEIEDPMMRPFGDVTTEPRHVGFSARELEGITTRPHPADPLRRSFTHSHFESAGVALRSAEAGGAGYDPSSPVAARVPPRVRE